MSSLQVCPGPRFFTVWNWQLTAENHNNPAGIAMALPADKQRDNLKALTKPAWTSPQSQGDHSPHHVKFPDDLRHSSAALGMLSITHIMPILVLNTCMDRRKYAVYNKQF